MGEKMRVTTMKFEKERQTGRTAVVSSWRTLK